MKKQIFQFCMTIIGIWFILSVAVTIVLNFRPLYYRDIKALSIEQTSGYSEEDIRENYDVLIDYNTIFGPKKLQFPTLPMSKTAEIHFEEVKHILLFFQYGLLITTPIIIWGVFVSIKRQLFQWLRNVDIGLCVLVASVSIYMAMDWDGFFIFFHKLMFKNDYWFFDYHTDPIILLLPDTFFLHFGVGLIVLVLIQMLIFWVLSNRLKKNKENNKQVEF